MKSITLLATLILTALAPVWAETTEVSGSAIHNPKPADCCSCVELKSFTVLPDTNGNYKLQIWGSLYGTPGDAVNHNLRCGDVLFKPDYKFTPNGTANMTLGQGGRTFKAEITLTSKQVEEMGKNAVWTFESFCAPDAKSALTSNTSHLNQARRGCKISFDIMKYCGTNLTSLDPCDNCPEGTPQVEQKSFIASIPTTRSFGGTTSGELKFLTTNFTNPGRSELFANVPSNFILNKDAQEIITSVETGNTTLTVTDAPLDILTQDPNAFTVTHKDASNNIFRTTTIYFVNEGGVGRLRMDTTYDGSTTRHEQTQPTPGTLVLEKGRVNGGVFEPIWQETLVKDESIPDKRIHRRIIKERPTFSAAWGMVSDIETTEENQVSEWVKTKEVIDKDGEALTSTWAYYQPGEITGPGASTEGLGRLKRFSSYDGDESFHLYSLHSETVITPYAGNIAGKTTVNSWNPSTRTRTVTTHVGGNILSKEQTVHTDTSTTTHIYTSVGETLTTQIYQLPVGQDFGGKPLRILHPDGTLTTYSYTRNAGGGYTIVTENGSTSNGTTVSQGMRSISTNNSRGITILSKTEAIGYGSANGLVYDLMAVTEVDNLGRAITTAYHPASASVTGEFATALSPAWTTNVEYSCCGISSETDKFGIKTFYAYDSLQRQIKSNRLGVTTETVRKGLTTETHRYAETITTSLPPSFVGDSTNLIFKSVRNLSGTEQEFWSPDPTSTTNGALVKSSSSVTTFQPATGISSRTVTTTADNFSQTTDIFLDGRTAKTYGDLSPAQQYVYTVNSIGEVIGQSYLDGMNLRETTTSQSDWAGRTLRIDYMDGAFATMQYNSLGQKIKSTDPDGVTSLIAYNTAGEQVIWAIDLNANGVIDYGVDTVSSSESYPSVDNSNNPVMKSVSKVWESGDSSSNGGTIVSTSLRSVNELATASQFIGVANPSTSVTTLSGNGNWTITNTAPDGTKSTSTYSDGKMVSMASLTATNSINESQTQGYDALNRLISSTHSRTGASTTNYLSTTADIVASVSGAGGRTTEFVYDVRGRQISVNAPDTLDSNNANLTNVTTTTYNPDSTVAETNGDQTYRVSHTYDYADRQISMTTYGTTTATTTWQYSTTRGFLLAKRDAANKGANYTYTAAGRLLARTWARGVTTTYSYDNGGRMVSTNYSDTTPDVVMSYDAMGRLTTQSNGVATSTFSYNSSNLQIDTETVAYDLNADNNIDFTRVIDRSRDNLNRESGWQLKVGTTIENEVAYAYGTTDGRLSSVNKGASSFGYTYVPNSSLIATVTSPAHTVSNVFETTRNVLASKVNKVGMTTISGYLYTVNNYGQRTGVNKDGTAFASTRDITWGYNAKGEVVKADSSISGLDRSYQYDGIGNRLKSADSLTLPSANNYTPNILNQYAAINSLTPVHDDDGNMTSGPLPTSLSANSTLIWDGENRLIEAQVNSGNTVNYLYDAQSRRIAETVSSATTVYIYDDWNPIAEYSTTYALTKTYTWGIDLSGSMQGAGGVGGLLAVTDSSGTYYLTYDGNGNVSEYLDSTGNTVAHYEYDPFGKTIVATGSKANDFSHRFSTKALDQTTGLNYYGYRFYDPETGRWPSRDPIEERGGVNLNGFVGNNSISWVDCLGLIPIDDPTIWSEIESQNSSKSIEIDAANDEFDRVFDHMFHPLSRRLSRTYGNDHPWTKHMKKKPVYDRMRNHIKKELRSRCNDNPESIVVYSGKWDDSADDHPWWQFAADLWIYATGSSVTSTGSVKGRFTAVANCKKCEGDIFVTLNDALRAGSMTRIPGKIPIIGDKEILNDNVLNIVDLTWMWNEKISF
jgi:RHS repeat-associated protein